MRAGRDLLLFAIGIVFGVIVTMLWPKSTFEECMVEMIHDPSPTKLQAAYDLCKDLPKKSKN
jgi:hypothetical protein